MNNERGTTMTYKEYINNLKRTYIGKKVYYNDVKYTVVDVDYNGGLLINKPATYTETTAVEIKDVIIP